MAEKQNKQNVGLALPTWILIWFFIGLPVQLWDALFILCRPHSMPGGKWNAYFALAFNKYIEIDHSYPDMNNSFVVAMSTVCVFEVLLGFVALFAGLMKKPSALVYTIMVSSITLAKTGVFFGMEYFANFHYTKHNNTQDFVLLYVIPSALWLLFPLLCLMSQVPRLIAIVNEKAKSK